MKLKLPPEAIAAAAERYRQLALVEAFNANDPESRPTPKQLEVLKDINRIKHRYITSGNQCLPGDTLVMTPKGPVRLDAIKVGDTVYDELGQEQSVVKTWYNGPKEIGDLVDTSGLLWGSCTKDHKFYCVGNQKIPAEKLTPDIQVLCVHATQKSIILSWGSNRRVVETYDITVNGKNNVYLLANGLVTSNSGKSQLAARECAWLFNDNHPFWTRPAAWGTEPLQLIVVGRITKQVEEVLWRKVSSFCNPEDLHIQRVGGIIQKVTHRKNKNTILFASHHNDREAREKLQSYECHWMWVDELPGSAKLLEELHRRVQSKKGYFIATFTPKAPNPEIKKLVDNCEEPYSKKYQFAMFDNPIYTEEDKKLILKSLETYPESYRRTVLYGDWAQADLNVYFFDREKMIEDPVNYHPNWRHCASVDPASESKFGFTLWAENPATGVWYLIRDDYISGTYSPEDYFQEVEKRLRGLNIVRRIVDSHEGWFKRTASSHGIHYSEPYSKNNRKSDLIKGLQAALSEGKIKIASWCTNLIDEIESCQWSESVADRIVNGRSYHLLDCCQYFVDCRPATDVQAVPKTWEQELREGNRERKKQERIAKQLKVLGRSRRWVHGRSGSRRFS